MNNTKLTLGYYNKQAKVYSKKVQGLDFSFLYKVFFTFIPDHGHILDLGCGGGRDSKAFIDAGYKVTAIDGSEEMCKIASNFIGQEVTCSTFQNYETDQIFDEIWALSAFVHLSYQEIIDVMNKLSSNLKSGGCFYVSFKYGNFSGFKNGRFFQDMTEEEFYKLLKKMPNYELISLQIDGDMLPREEIRWLNIFLKRK